jgi:uncharacterized protein YwqG
MDKIKENLRKNNIEYLESSIKEVMKPSVRLLKVSEEPKIGESKIGGMPDVPKNFTYPMNGNTPLPFLMQINLNELTNVAPDHILPKEGMLYLFYDIEEQPWGLEEEDKESWKVIYVNEIENLKEIDVPVNYNEETKIIPFKLTFEKRISYPNWDTTEFEKIKFKSEEDEDKYFKFVQEMDGEEPLHQMFGHPLNIQGDVFGEIDYYFHQEKREVKYKNWELLFQIDTDDDLNLMWGDVGMIYFCIDPSDAIKGNFDEVRFCLQCH